MGAYCMPKELLRDFRAKYHRHVLAALTVLDKEQAKKIKPIIDDIFLRKPYMDNLKETKDPRYVL